MDDPALLQHHQRRENLPGEPLHDGQRKSSELVLREHVEKSHAQELEDQTDVALELEGLEQPNDVLVVVRVLRVEIGRDLDLQLTLRVVGGFALDDFNCAELLASVVAEAAEDLAEGPGAQKVEDDERAGGGLETVVDAADEVCLGVIGGVGGRGSRGVGEDALRAWWVRVGTGQ